MCNGRRGNDQNIGNFTCCTNRGKRLVDYVLCSGSLMSEIIYFDIKGPIQCSMHCANEFSLCTNTVFTETIVSDDLLSESVNYCFKWNREDRTQFLTRLQGEDCNKLMKD